MTEKDIVKEGINYILKNSSVNIEKLDYYLNEWEFKKPKSLEELFKNLLISAKNTGGMPNFIGDIDNLEPFLCNYSPRKIIILYGCWENLFDKINNSNFTTPSPMKKDEIRNSWVKYCKSIIDSAKFLARFENFSDFKNYVNQFINPENTDLRIALPLIIKEEIYNVGFALSCDFIKENISPEFIKPDVHINKIFIGIGICKHIDSDYEIFRKIILFSQRAEKKPYWIDKLFWLIGSGKFYENMKYPIEEKFKTSRDEFIKLINDKKPAANNV
jgi:hypothetical protein